METHCLKPELEPLPERMKDLPVDARGYVVPWFVAWKDANGGQCPAGWGEPEFRAMDQIKFQRAVREKLCWVCGKTLGVNVCFVAGPMCGINRTSSEPPNHLECARWSARNCPFLNNPRAVRREDEYTLSRKENTAGIGLDRNPGVSMLWITRSYEILRLPNGILITMGEPESVEWYACGRPATRAQVMESIETGLPNLEAMARTEKGGIESLRKYQARFEKWIPVETTNA